MVDYEIKKDKDMERIMLLATLSKFHQSFPKRLLIPSIKEIGFIMIYSLPKSLLMSFSGLVKFTPIDTKGVNYNFLFRYWKNLVSLDIALCDTIDFSMLPQLTKLSCSSRTKDSDLLHLTNLKRLRIPFNHGKTSRITNESLSRLTNLTTLNIGTINAFYANDKDTISFDNKALENLSKLRTLKMRGATCRGLDHTYFYHLSQLTKLDTSFINLPDRCFEKLTNLKILCLGEQTNGSSEDLLTLSNLNELHLSKAALSDRGDYPFEKLPNLRKLSLIATYGVKDHHITNLTNLTFLSLCDNDVITGKAVSLLTNLTELDLQSCTNIRTKHLLNLGKLKKVRESDTRCHFYSF